MFGSRKSLPKKLTKSAKGCFTERQKLFLLNFARHNYELAFESVGTDEVFRWFMSNRHSLDELGVTERLAVNYMKMWNSWVDRAKRLGWSKTLGDHHDITLYMIYTRTEAGYNASHVNAGALTSKKGSSSPVPATTTYRKTDVTPRRSLSREPSMPFLMEPSTDKATQYGKKLAKAFFSGFVEEYRSCEKAQETTEETVLVPDSDEERALMDYPDIHEELNIKPKQKPLATIDVNTYEEDEYVKEYLLKQKSLYEDDEFYCLIANIENVKKKKAKEEYYKLHRD